MSACADGVHHQVVQRSAQDGGYGGLPQYSVSSDGRVLVSLSRVTIAGQTHVAIDILDLIYGCKRTLEGKNVEKAVGILAVTAHSFVFNTKDRQYFVVELNNGDEINTRQLIAPEGWWLGFTLLKPQVSNEGNYIWIEVGKVTGDHIGLFDLSGNEDRILPMRIFRSLHRLKDLRVIGKYMYSITTENEETFSIKRVHMDEGNSEQLYTRRGATNSNLENFGAHWIGDWVLFIRQQSVIAISLKTEEWLQYTHSTPALIVPVNNSSLTIIEPLTHQHSRPVRHMYIRRPESLFNIATRAATTSVGVQFPRGLNITPQPLCNDPDCAHFQRHKISVTDLSSRKRHYDEFPALKCLF